MRLKRYPQRIPLILALAVLAGCMAYSPREQVGRRHRDFRFIYRVKLPPDSTTHEWHVFLPLAPTNVKQTIMERVIKSPWSGEIGRDSLYGNIYWHGYYQGAVNDTVMIEVSYRVRRWYYAPRAGGGNSSETQAEHLQRWLQGSARVPVSGPLVDSILQELPPVTDGTVSKARAVYDYVIDHMEYKKVGTGWGQGDTYWACSAHYGNCTDFHALFLSLARAEGIPAKFEIGFPIPTDRKAGRIAGYHCWVEFYAPGSGWFPVDASEARKHPDRRDLYFGCQPLDRIKFTIGRDLRLGPGHTTGPLNYFIYPHIERDGQLFLDYQKEFYFQDLK